MTIDLNVVTEFPPTTVPLALAHVKTPGKTATRILSSSSQRHLRRNDGIILIVFPSDVESLKQGIIKTSKNKTKVPYTIFLVGETGVGKSSVFELIANVLAGNDIGHYDLDILDRANEQGGSNNQSQTNSARFYTLTSKNGIVVSVYYCEHDEYA